MVLGAYSKAVSSHSYDERAPFSFSPVKYSRCLQHSFFRVICLVAVDKSQLNTALVSQDLQPSLFHGLELKQGNLFDGVSQPFSLPNLFVFIPVRFGGR